MEPDNSEAGGTWVPQACTLPTAERPLRVAAFDELFASAVRGIDRAEAARLRLDLNPSSATAARAAELALAETGCCSFFTFTLTADGGGLVLDIAVPAAQTAVLDALAARAVATARTAE
jgi:hypothetical protein